MGGYERNETQGQDEGAVPGPQEPPSEPSGSEPDAGSDALADPSHGGRGAPFAGLIVWGIALILIGVFVAYLGWSNPTISLREGITRSPWYYVGLVVVGGGAGTFLAGLYRLLGAVHRFLGTRARD